MAGTKAGGRAAAATNKSKYGADFYAKIGAAGGKKGKTGGFYANRELARIAGKKGGTVSRRGPDKTKRKVAVREVIEYTPRPSLLDRLFNRA
jgi:general stress protein YciG